MTHMPRPRAEQPPPPRADVHHGKPCYVTRWRSIDGRQHTQRFYVENATAMAREFKAWLKIWKADPRVREPHRPDGLTVKQMTEVYVKWAKQSGVSVSHLYKVTRAIDLLCELYGERPADSVSAPDLAAWREWLVRDDRSRATINAYLGCAKACYQWAIERGLVKAEVANEVQAVAWLSRGRTKAKESKKIESVSLDIVKKTVKVLQPHVASMVWVQWYTGMRPDEVCGLRATDIDRTGTVWFYRPPHHKTAHLGAVREVGIGPKARAILAPLMMRLGYLFRPSEGEKAHHYTHKRYVVSAYRRAITRACEKAGVPKWSPNMLRHAFATRVKQSHGVDASRAAMGHTTADTTTLYLDRDRELAAKVAEEVG